MNNFTCIPLTLALSSLFIAAALNVTFANDAVILKFDNGVITSLENRAAGEELDSMPSAPLTGIRKLDNKHLWNDSAQIAERQEGSVSIKTFTWKDENGESKLITRIINEDNGDIVLEQEAKSASPGLVGTQWGIVASDNWDLLVPTWGGAKYSYASPMGSIDLDYPTYWEAQFIILQGHKGGVLIYAEDNAQYFKALHIGHQPGKYLIGLESRCTAPFDNITEHKSFKWRIKAYKGDWLVGAEIYRKWADETFEVAKAAASNPKWVQDIQFFVTTGLDQKEALEDLAKKVDPGKTMLYVPSWRKAGYDYNYPDYTPADGVAEQIKFAKKLGFKVMLHVNHFGVTNENPVYEKMKQYHFRDPFTKELMHWDLPDANPRIKFAYINPAAKEWRKFFVEKMVELHKELQPDALFIDQTLCMYNDANGLIDGMNSMQGNIALHRELREALPDLPLAGEGLNEISYRYEAFAQRHPYGIDFISINLDKERMEMAHPISSSIFGYHTKLYGYLGMPAPEDEPYYMGWLAVYERYGVLPTYAWPMSEFIKNPPAALDVLIDVAKWFQENQPQPDFTPGWSKNTLFAYKTRDGKRAEYRREHYGVILGIQPDNPEDEWKRVYARITGVDWVKLPGTIPNWYAYDDEKIMGLVSSKNYVYKEKPRDLKAFHISSLPEELSIKSFTVRKSFASAEIEDREAFAGDFTRFAGIMRAGETSNDGKKNFVSILPFESESGASVNMEGNGIFMHPPWKAGEKKADGVTQAKGLGCTWLEFEIELPNEKSVRFESGVGLKGNVAQRHSDGVTFKISAWEKTKEFEVLKTELHTKFATPQLLALDLTPLKGKYVVIRLEVDSGPAGDSTYDWALWTSPRLIYNDLNRKKIQVVSPKSIKCVIPAKDNESLKSIGKNAYEMEVSTGSTYFLFEKPQAVKIPANLRDLKYEVKLRKTGGREIEPYGFAGASLGELTIDGITKKGLNAHPPFNGETQITFLLNLPKGKLAFAGSAGINDGAKGKSDGVEFSVFINGEKLWSKIVQAGEDWSDFKLPLDKYEGQPVIICLATNSLAKSDYDWAFWGDLKIIKQDDKK